MTCNASTIKPSGVCLECLSPKQLMAIKAYLLCQYANKPPAGGSALLLESGSYILLEGGGKILLE